MERQEDRRTHPKDKLGFLFLSQYVIPYLYPLMGGIFVVIDTHLVSEEVLQTVC